MFIIGKKIRQTQIWDKEDKLTPVTEVKCVPNQIQGFKIKEKDGYDAVILTDGKIVKEYRPKNLKKLEEFKEKKEIDLTVFEENDKIIGVGVTKGKGFQGVVKRHGFKGGFATHGHRHDLRQTGSIGSAFPQHVMKGKKMAGRMGGDNKKIKNLTIVKIEPDGHKVLIKGSLPGFKGSTVFLEKR
jgi:large subunit ribosomal protein L3